MGLREQFIKIYDNLPVSVREQVVVVVDKQPISWSAAYLEVVNNTELGNKILNILDNLGLL